MLILGFPLFAVGCLAVVGLRRRPPAARRAYLLLLLLSATPYLLYVWYTWGYIRRSSFEGPEGGTAIYPGLVAFVAAGVAVAVALLALSAALLRRLPLLTALTPLVLGFFFWTVALRVIYWTGPAFLMLDNMPLVWLFAWSAFTTVLLLLTAWIALVRGGTAA